jgi:hypothetical protein
MSLWGGLGAVFAGKKSRDFVSSFSLLERLRRFDVARIDFVATVAP